MALRISMVPAVVALAALGCAGLAGCAAPGSGAASGPDPAPGGEPVVRRGDFERRVLLTGALEADQAIQLVVPRTPNWRVELQWMADDGSAVRAGERVVELDDSEFATDLEDKETSLAESLSELERRRTEVTAETREKEFEVVRRRAELEKAQIEARVPEELVARQTLGERRLAVEKARLELAKAEADLRAHLEASRADLEVQQIEIRKARREIDAARRAIRELTLHAPEDGIFLVGTHPWEDRKLQVGDLVWVGLVVGTLPDLDSLVVEARLPDVDDGAVAPGMPATVTLDAYPGESFPGVVREVAPVAQDEAGESLRRSFRAVVDLERIDPQRMIPGMSARVEVLAERRPSSLLAPRSALSLPPAGNGEGPQAGATAVLYLAGGGTAEVRLGPCGDLECVLDEGPAPGTRLAAAAAPRAGTGAVAGSEGEEGAP